ncbi:glutamate-ammonia-ligase adenylyltransferase domain protein [Mycobacterium avium subsp. avium 2285 (R)]|nr:glutamate-ammonia-ligase adenylyltransferase domain protein [Mycobacterium avium subsp. avium 2285 (R)]
MTSEAAERQLAALGYEGPQSALKHMSALVNQSGRRGRVQSVLLPRLLNWMSYAPDPDGGLLAYRRLSEALAGESWYLSTLRDKPAVARRLMHVLGTSAYVPDLLMRAPRVIQDYGDGPSGPGCSRPTRPRWPARWSPRPAGTPTRCGRSPGRAPCAAGSWPGWRRRTCSACSRSPTCARR